MTRETRSTIRDVAGACGVSEATVSYALNGKRTLKAATREKILLAARKLNYHPSALARGLANQRVRTLGVLFDMEGTVDFVTHPYASGLLKGVMNAAQAEGFDITLFTAKWVRAEISIPPLGDGRTNGILAISPRIDSDILEGLAGLGLPFAAISAQDDPNIANFEVDNFQGVLLATRYLLGLGHRRIAYLTGDAELASCAPRSAGYRAALAEAEIQVAPELLLPSSFDGRLVPKQSVQLLALPSPPTAIMTGNDGMAMKALETARRLGIRVPEDLSVMGFDDDPAACYTTPSLTTVHQPLAAIGAAAACHLIEAMRHNHACPPVLTVFPPELVIRASTAAPAQPAQH